MKSPHSCLSALLCPLATEVCPILIIDPLVIPTTLVISCNISRLCTETPVSMRWGGAPARLQEKIFLFLEHQSHISILFKIYIYIYSTSDYNCFHFNAKGEYLKQWRRGRHRVCRHLHLPNKAAVMLRVLGKPIRNTWSDKKMYVT